MTQLQLVVEAMKRDGRGRLMKKQAVAAGLHFMRGKSARQ
jgi:hypothetical protein